MVPKGAKAGDLIAAKDDQGHDVRVRVPVGAVKGVHLCVCVCVFARAVCEYSGSTQVLACTLHPLLIPCIVVCFCAHTHAHTYGHVCSTCVCVCVCVCTRVCTGTLLRENSAYFRAAMKEAGFSPLEGETPIVPIIIGETAAAIISAE